MEKIMNKESLTKFVSEHIWYQRFRLPYGITIGQMDCEEKWRRMQMPKNFSGQSILDLGCDLGWYCFQAKQQGAGRVLGIDIDEKSIEGAKSIRDKIFCVEDIEFRVGDVEHLVLNETFDYVLLLATLHRIKNTQPPYFASIEAQLTLLNKLTKLVNNVFVLEFKPHNTSHKTFLETLFPIVEDLGSSITPDHHERRILKCRRH